MSANELKELASAKTVADFDALKSKLTISRPLKDIRDDKQRNILLLACLVGNAFLVQHLIKYCGFERPDDYEDDEGMVCIFVVNNEYANIRWWVAFLTDATCLHFRVLLSGSSRQASP